MKLKVKIYKVISTYNNVEVLRSTLYLFDEQIDISSQQLSALQLTTQAATLQQLNNRANVNNEWFYSYDNFNYEHLTYFVVYKNKVVCKFEHTYIPFNNQMYISNVTTCMHYRGKGIGTPSYRQVIKDIVATYNVNWIVANAITTAGRRFLTGLGFLPNTNAQAYECNAILYLNGDKPFLMELNDVPTARDILNMPNMQLYLSVVDEAAVAGNFNKDKAKEVFFQTYDKLHPKCDRPSIEGENDIMVPCDDMFPSFDFDDTSLDIQTRVKLYRDWLKET